MVDWNDGMDWTGLEWWNGLEWNNGMDRNGMGAKQSHDQLSPHVQIYH